VSGMIIIMITILHELKHIGLNFMDLNLVSEASIITLLCVNYLQALYIERDVEVQDFSL